MLFLWKARAIVLKVVQNTVKVVTVKCLRYILQLLLSSLLVEVLGPCLWVAGRSYEGRTFAQGVLCFDFLSVLFLEGGLPHFLCAEVVGSEGPSRAGFWPMPTLTVDPTTCSCNPWLRGSLWVTRDRHVDTPPEEELGSWLVPTPFVDPTPCSCSTHFWGSFWATWGQGSDTPLEEEVTEQEAVLPDNDPGASSPWQGKSVSIAPIKGSGSWPSMIFS